MIFSISTCWFLEESFPVTRREELFVAPSRTSSMETTPPGSWTATEAGTSFHNLSEAGLFSVIQEAFSTLLLTAHMARNSLDHCGVSSMSVVLASLTFSFNFFNCCFTESSVSEAVLLTREGIASRTRLRMPATTYEITSSLCFSCELSDMTTHLRPQYSRNRPRFARHPSN